MKKLVILETPYRGDGYKDLKRNIKYARACVRNCLLRGESPLAFHLLYTQRGISNDKNPDERTLCMKAAEAWESHAEAIVVYTDLGISYGMRLGIERAQREGRPVIYRKLEEEKEDHQKSKVKKI